MSATKKLQKSRNRIDQQASVKQLESLVMTYQKICQSYLQAYVDSIQVQLYPTTSARIISPATLPFKKNAPKSKLLLVLAVLAGMALGLAHSLFRKMSGQA
jgi:uncharacterized protein involved in exopolysaccharide biosynthesis